MASNVKSLNRVILIGNVQPRDPEITHIPSLGRDVAKFTVVTKEGYMDKNNQWQESSEWHNCVAWGPITQKIQRSVSRGSLILVEGKIKSRKWQDKNGQDRRTTEINLENLVVLEKAGTGSSGFQGDNSSNRGGSGSGQSGQYNPPGDLNQEPPEQDINEFPDDEITNDPF